MERVKPKKRLGQHFLRDEDIASRISQALVPDDDSQVIEIGPGTGVLTKYLLEPYGDKLTAYDVDKESIDYLKAKYVDYERQFILGDFLEFQVDPKSKLSVIGNFPYNISSQIFFKIWENHLSVNQVVCMIQKEVADRIVSDHGNKVYGILSVLLQAFYEIECLFTVPPQVFDPPPKVQSSVIRLRRKDQEPVVNKALLKRIVKAGFGKRRKTLRNALKELNLPGLDLQAALFDRRAEQLSVEEFISLTQSLEPDVRD